MSLVYIHKTFHLFIANKVNWFYSVLNHITTITFLHIKEYSQTKI